MFSMKMDTSQVDRRLKKFAKDNPAATKKALEVAGLQFLTWVVNGSSKESRKPPIRRGFLRGSGSVFRGSKLVGTAPGYDNKEANTSHSANDEFELTWGFNADYATRMHEAEYAGGPYTQQDGDAGNKYLERHLQADKKLLLEVIARVYKKEAGT